ncbi:hypothetical protein ACB092_01G351400 [Castanea dentata]
MSSRKRVLVVGGTGYLGQHILQFARLFRDPRHPIEFDLAFTYHSNLPQPLLDVLPHLLAFHPDVVVNCSALSVLHVCEMDPAAALSVNVSSSLVDWLSNFKEGSTLLIHLSTDQVYEGVKSFYKEEDETVPVNVYEKSKVAAEQFWIDAVLSKGEKMDFFHNEFGCPVYVKDVLAIIRALTSRWISQGKQMQLLLNVGGPDRVSWVQMAEAVADFKGYNTQLINAVSASSVDRGIKSPADISMNITKLVQTLNFSPTSYTDGVKLTLTTEAKS